MAVLLVLVILGLICPVGIRPVLSRLGMPLTAARLLIMVLTATTAANRSGLALAGESEVLSKLVVFTVVLGHDIVLIPRVYLNIA